MGRNELQKPTEAEIELLKVMWDRGPCTVRDIHEALQTDTRQTAYTTTLKLLQVMHAKGLVIRDESQRAHRFAATVSREATERVFGGGGVGAWDSRRSPPCCWARWDWKPIPPRTGKSPSPSPPRETTP